MAEKEGVIRFGLYIIWSVRNGGLYSVLRAIGWSNIDLGGDAGKQYHRGGLHAGISRV